MKKLCLITAVSFFLCSCGDGTGNDTTNASGDSVGLTNPTAIDTVKHPTGMDNSSVISTDTAAMNMQNSVKKADSAARAKQ